jgi:hypothetical protein
VENEYIVMGFYDFGEEFSSDSEPDAQRGSEDGDL